MSLQVGAQVIPALLASNPRTKMVKSAHLVTCMSTGEDSCTAPGAGIDQYWMTNNHPEEMTLDPSLRIPHMDTYTQIYTSG